MAVDIAVNFTLSH